MSNKRFFQIPQISHFRKGNGESNHVYSHIVFLPKRSIAAGADMVLCTVPRLRVGQEPTVLRQKGGLQEAVEGLNKVPG